MIYLGADHGGYKLKQLLKAKLTSAKLQFQDLGAQQLKPNDDYPLLASAVAKKVAGGHHRGILFCRSGVGVCIVANKIPGVRAVLASDSWTAVHSRHDDDTNVLCLAAERNTIASAWAIIRAWLKAPYAKLPRYRRRLAEIKRLERG